MLFLNSQPLGVMNYQNFTRFETAHPLGVTRLSIAKIHVRTKILYVLFVYAKTVYGIIHMLVVIPFR